MATVICMDGLGGHPETTFGSLKIRLVKAEHQVTILDTARISTHEDRVAMVIEEYMKNRDGRVFLIGQSAGGSAVRIASEILNETGNQIAGVVQLSPAMPFGVMYMTRHLFKVMALKSPNLLFSRKISTTRDEYGSLVGPVGSYEMQMMVSMRERIPGPEARRLAFFPPRFVGYSYPTLHIFGSEDRWISPRAQRKLSSMLSRKSVTTTLELPVGHLTLASTWGDTVERVIERWIAHT